MRILLHVYRQERF
jgi:hypothetical protein